MSIKLSDLLNEAYLGSLLLSQAGISPNNDRLPWTEDEQYGIESVEFDIDGIYVTNYGERIRLKVCDMSVF